MWFGGVRSDRVWYGFRGLVLPGVIGLGMVWKGMGIVVMRDAVRSGRAG